MSKCVYCGSEENITREHIPPKALFPPPKPSNLITVPACNTCNGKKSIDDEYFNWFLNVNYSVHQNNSVKKKQRSNYKRDAATSKIKFQDGVAQIYNVEVK